jgi:hypothetical protein
VLLSLRTGTSTPAEVIDKLGSPISKELVAGGEVLTFSYPGEVLRVFVDRPGSDQDYVIMIHGPKDPLCLVFSGGVLTSAYKKMPLPRKSRR